MTSLFLTLVNLSIAAGWLVLAVLLLRLLLRRVPKWTRCILWALVALRLLCPVTVESALSLVPSVETVPREILYAETPAIRSGVSALNGAVNPVLAEHFAPAVGDSANPLQIVLPVLAAVWLAGMIGMLGYALLSWLRLRRRVAVSIPLEQGVRLCDDLGTPFLLGIFRPMIYLPSALDEAERGRVLLHERAHLPRRDHWWKPLGFLLLSVYWFHPLLWLGYILFCRDIELACDERVLRQMGQEERADYAQTLLDLSRARPAISACPLAFGEVGVGARVKAALRYRKPGFWIILGAVLVCAVTAVCFLTGPKSEEPDLSFLNYQNAIPLVADRESVQAIYCPAQTNDENGEIRIGVAEGAALAAYLDGANWRKRAAPAESLASPGSVEFILEEDYRITVYQTARWARVTYEGETQYYRTQSRDYTKALSLVSQRVEFVPTVPPSNALIVWYDPEALTQEDLDALGWKHGFTAVKNFGRNDLFSAYYEEQFTNLSMYQKLMALAQEPHILDVIPAETPVRTEAELREQCPEYFDLDTFKGLEVYVWQMAPGSYSCGVMIGTNRNKTNEEIWNLHRNPVSIGEMRTILASYDIPQENVSIIPVHMPFSSYAYTIDDAYLENLRTLFWR